MIKEDTIEERLDEYITLKRPKVFLQALVFKALRRAIEF